MNAKGANSAGAENSGVSSSANLLLEEYKIIQGKIDKLGEDKFKVRTWCITIVTGVFAAAKFTGATTTFSNTLAIVAIFLVLIRAFQLVELRQKQIQHRMGDRAKAIENYWRKQSRATAPQLATVLIREGIKDHNEFSFQRLLGIKKKSGRSAPRPTMQPAGVFSQGQSTGERSDAAVPDAPASRRPSALQKETPARPSFTEFSVANADNAFYWIQYIILVSLLSVYAIAKITRFGRDKTVDQLSPAVILQFGTNQFRLNIQQTNIEVTNFSTVLAWTTNFSVVQAVTTNYSVTNIPTTNFIGAPGTSGK